MMNDFLDFILSTAPGVEWWHFWNPGSGFRGGFTMGCVIMFIVWLAVAAVA